MGAGSRSHDHSGTAAIEGFFAPLRLPTFPCAISPGRSRQLFLPLSVVPSRCRHTTPPPHPFPRHPSTATALSKSTRPLIHPGASRPPYRLREDIIIIACLLFRSLPPAPSIRPSSRPWWVRQSLRRWVIVVQRAGVGWGECGGLQPAVPDSPEQRLHHAAPLLERLACVRLLLTVCMCVRRHMSSALATIC